MIEAMKKLAKAKEICVLATVSGEKPHCSLMAYATNDDCTEIYMAAHRNTRKYKNLTENPSVSLLIDTREEHTGARLPEGKAMTVSGLFERVEDEGKKAMIRGRLLKTHPYLDVFLDHQESELLCIKIRSFLLLEGFTEAHFEEAPA